MNSDLDNSICFEILTRVFLVKFSCKFLFKHKQSLLVFFTAYDVAKESKFHCVAVRNLITTINQHHEILLLNATNPVLGAL